MKWRMKIKSIVSTLSGNKFRTLSLRVPSSMLMFLMIFHFLLFRLVHKSWPGIWPSKKNSLLTSPKLSVNPFLFSILKFIILFTYCPKIFLLRLCLLHSNPIPMHKLKQSSKTFVKCFLLFNSFVTGKMTYSKFYSFQMEMLARLS